ALRNADIEIRKPPVTTPGIPNATVVGLNAGDARFVNPQGDVPVVRGSVQGLSGGRMVSENISVSDLAPALSSRTTPARLPAPTPVSVPANLPPVMLLATPPVGNTGPVLL